MTCKYSSRERISQQTKVFIAVVTKRDDDDACQYRATREPINPPQPPAISSKRTHVQSDVGYRSTSAPALQIPRPATARKLEFTEASRSLPLSYVT